MNLFICRACIRSNLNLNFISSTHSWCQVSKQANRVTHLTDSPKLFKRFFHTFLCQDGEREMTYQESSFALIKSKHSTSHTTFISDGISQLFTNISNEIEIPQQRFPFQRPLRLKIESLTVVWWLISVHSSTVISNERIFSLRLLLFLRCSRYAN